MDDIEINAICPYLLIFSFPDFFSMIVIFKFNSLIWETSEENHEIFGRSIFALKSRMISLRMILADNTEVNYLLYTDNFDEIWRG